jgi:preprotein translocase subunit SecD
MRSGRILAALALLACAIVPPAPAAECPPSSASGLGHILAAKNAPPWGGLHIWQREPATSVAAAEAEVARIGGSRLLLEIDVRSQIGAELRADTIRVLRDARLVWAHPPVWRDNGIEVRLRNADDTARALNLLRENLAVPLASPSAPGIEISDLGDKLVRLTPFDASIAGQIGMHQRIWMSILEKRVGGLGLAGGSVRPAGLGRLRAVVPGLDDPQQLLRILFSWSHLEFRLVDASIDPCAAVSGSIPPTSEILFNREGKDPILVEKQLLVQTGGMANVAVALAPLAGQTTVVFHLGWSGHRFATVTRENVGRSFAIVLDGRVVAVARIAEPLNGAVELSGGLDLPQAEELALFLQVAAGPPARLVIIEQQIVAPPAR